MVSGVPDMTTQGVSIVVPTYNEEKLLPLCLDSIKKLDYPAEFVEVIVVDNGSTDTTRSLAEAAGAKVLRNDHLGVAGLRNLGAKQAAFEILAFIDADCLVENDLLKKASIYFEADDIAAWGAPPAIPEQASWVQKTWYLVRKKEKPVQEVEWLESMNLFVRKREFMAVGGFSESLVTCEDVDFSYRIRTVGRIISDSDLKVVHLGEARTLREFVKKEIWRGKSNLTGVFKHGLSLKELPSLAVPLYFGILLPIVVLFTILIPNSLWTGASLLLILLPSVAVLFKMRKKLPARSLVTLLRLLFLVHIYFFARTIAVIK